MMKITFLLVSVLKRVNNTKQIKKIISFVMTLIVIRLDN